MPRTPVQQLVYRALSGDPGAADELARHARALARRALRRYFWCSEDIEDCTQEVCVRVLSHLKQLRDPARFEGWVVTIARHAALARQRDSRTLPLPVDDGRGEVPTPRRPPGSPVEMELHCAHACLSPARRELLDMRYRDELGYAEIAQRLRTTVPIVRRRLQSARNQLRKEVLKHMASEHGDAIRLDRADLDCLYAAASLVDPESADGLRAVHVVGRHVLGGTTHRAALGILTCKQDLPPLALDPGPFLDLVDRCNVKEGFLGFDTEGVRVALDDGSVVHANHISCDSPDPRAWGIGDWPLAHSVDASRPEMLELAEHIAGAGWGGGEKGEGSAIGCLIVVPGQVAASVVRRAAVTFMLSAQLGCVSETDGELLMRLNRAYLRDCLAALPRAAERVRLDFGGALDPLRFSTATCPGLIVAMMPMHPDHLSPEEREAWAECLALQENFRTRAG